MRILVTGIAGDIGNGIGRILRDTGKTSKLVGCDIHTEHMGLFFFDCCELVPRADSESYINSLVELARRYDLDAIIPTSEQELRLFLRFGISGQLDGIPLIMANIEAMRIGFDKLETARFLAKQDLPYPWTIKVSDNDPKQLPCIMKSRVGAGGKDVRLVDDLALIPALRQIYPDYIWQEYVGTADDEYTCGLYRSLNGDVRSIIFRRRLSGGFTSYGEVVANKEIENLCVLIAESIKLNGSINVQLRLTTRGPMVFEINPRFSSTVTFRHRLGFQDVVWSITEKLQAFLPDYKESPRVGTKIFRKFEEVIL